MKVDYNAQQDAQKKEEIPLLSLVPVKRSLKKSDVVIFKLRSDPTNADSPTYEVSMPYLHGTEDLRSVLEFKLNLTKIFIGMNAGTDAAAQNQLVKRILKDTALTSYDAGVQKAIDGRHETLKAVQRAAGVRAGDDDAQMIIRLAAVPRPTDINVGDITYAVDDLVSYMTPFKALQRIKRYLRRSCRKPNDMTTRQFYNHFTRINTEELPALPPAFNVTQSLGSDESVDIMMFAVPKKWHGEMERQGFDPFASTPEEIVAFCERLEAAESVEGSRSSHNSNQNSEKKSGKKKSSRKKARDDDDNSSKLYCLVHGECGHSSNDCSVLQKEAKQLQKDYTAKKSGGKTNTWSRKAEEAKSKSSKELAAFVKKAVREEMNAVEKKRKPDSDDEEGELNAIDLSNFDYDLLDNLKIESDDSSVEV